MSETDTVLGSPQPFEVKRVEIKKTLAPKDGQPAATILKLGLLHPPSGNKMWAEYFGRKPEDFPTEGATETFILTQPENPEWALKAARPRSGGGGFKGRSPADTKRIERMHAQEMAIRFLSEQTDLEVTLDTVRMVTKHFVEDTGA